MIVHSNGSLVISSVESGDQQQYICEVINEAGTDLSLVSLIVMGTLISCSEPLASRLREL